MADPNQNDTIVKQIAHVLLFMLVILIWGVSWTVNKIALLYFPPLWFTSLRCLVGMLSLFFIYIALNKKIYIPKRQDLFLILSLGFLQIGLFQLCINLGLMHVAAGRSAVLVYTTPIWVVPMATLIFKEHLSLMKFIGFILGIFGILVLFEPNHFNWHDKQVVLDNGMLLLAALSWAIAIMISKHAKWHATTFDLIGWQMLIASIITTVMACIYQPFSAIQWTLTAIETLLFTGCITMALGYWGIVVVSRYFASVTTSLCLLAVPILGALVSALVIHEPLTMPLIIAMILIVIGLGFVILGGAHKSVIK